MTRISSYTIVIILDLFLAGTALLGGLFLVPGLPPSWLEGGPFRSFLLPALALTLIGVVALVGALALAFERPLGILASLAAGVAITVFEIVQIAVLTLGDWLYQLGITLGHRVTSEGAEFPPALLLEPVYIAIGLAIALWSLRMYRQLATAAVDNTQNTVDHRKAA
jgi:hypothetical protein